MKHWNDTHGHTKLSDEGQCNRSSEYNTWCTMKARCHQPNSAGFKKYGAKGIQVCQRWRESFEAFISDMGRKPSPNHSIDRINNDGDYEPGNCRWATKVEQMNNMSTNRLISYDGRVQTLAQWSRESGVDADIISLRITQFKWDVKRAIFTPERVASSGVKGVYYRVRSRNKWYACFMKNGVSVSLGCHGTILDAAAAILGNAKLEKLLEIEKGTA